MRAVAQALALTPCPGLWRDRHLRFALAAGAVFWAVLAAWFPVRPLAPGDLLTWPYLHLAVAAPVLEELAFRGALMGWFHDYRWGGRRILGLTGANLAATLVFTALHFLGHPPPWAASVAVPSLLFGHLRDRHASVLPAVLLHVVYNAGYFALTGLPAAPGAALPPLS